MYYILISIIAIAVLAILVKKTIFLDIITLVEQEAAGKKLSSFQIGRFPQKDWDRYRKNIFHASYQDKIVLHYARTGKVLDYKSAVEAFGDRGPQSYFNSLTEIIPWATEKRIRNKLTTNVFEKTHMLLTHKDETTPEYLNERVSLINKKYPGYNPKLVPIKELFAEFKVEQGIRDEADKQLAKKRADNKAVADKLAYEQKMEQLELEKAKKERLAARRAEELELQDEERRNAPVNQSTGRNKGHGLPESESYLIDTGGIFNDLKTVDRRNSEFPFPTNEEWFDSSRETNIKIERQLMNSNSAEWIFLEQRFESKNALFYSLVSSETKHIRKPNQ